MDGQYETREDVLNATKTFVGALNILVELKKNTEIFSYNCHGFYLKESIKGTKYISALRKDKVSNDIYLKNMKLLGNSFWEEEYIHDYSCSYIHNAIEFVSTSVAEIAERKIQNNTLNGFLLNFEKSYFSKLKNIYVLKDNKFSVIVDCNCTKNTVIDWFKAKGYIVPYDPNSKNSPDDEQTVLAQSDFFELTQYKRQNGRRVYRRIGTNQLWYVDSSPRHATEKAHIEVFDEKKKHLGTSLYNEINVDKSHLDPQRTIDIDSR
jgi:hypothetical protein